MPAGASRAAALRSFLHPHRWPVRWRLAGASAALTLAILVLFGAIIGNLAAQRVRSDFNREVKAAATRLASQVHIVYTISNGPIVYGPRSLSDFVSANEASVVIRDASGVRRAAVPPSTNFGRPVPGIHTLGKMRVDTVLLRSGETGEIAGYVQYGRNLEHVDSTINRLWFFIVAGILGATLLASLAGLAIARRAMRPISSLTAAARRIAETGDSSRRMPEPKLDDEVGELAHTLEQMLRSLDAAKAETETAMKKQREFVADASHELRTPLTSILANLELLQASLNGDGHEDEQPMIDSALRSSTRMSRLVADLLLLARADAGRGRPHRRCDLAEVAGHAAAEVAPTLGDRRLLVENGHPLPLDGDPDELHRMVLNLLDNARRHTPPGATIELRLRGEDGEAVLEVADDGPGIPPELRDAVFDRFARGNGPADTALGPGSGLGLAIVRAVAESHGGTAEAAASESGGALLRVRIPLLPGPSDSKKRITPALDRL
jgi:two-component system OmpR family sensor kinase